MPRRCAHFVLFAIWMIALCAGWWAMTTFQYATDTTHDDVLAPEWPAKSKLNRSPTRSTLVLFLHPRCPCSRASITELEGLLAKLQSERVALPDIDVLATVPEVHSSEWTGSETVRRAAHLPGARVFIDASGVEAKRFDAVTSGTIMFFDRGGQRLYNGGVTVARGLEGQNAGLDAIDSLLRGKPVLASNMPVFGCRLCLPQNATPQAIAATAAFPGAGAGQAAAKSQ